MKSLIAVIVMAAWTVAVWYLMSLIGFQHHLHDLLWSLGAAVALLIGLVGNVWIFFMVTKESPYEWVKSKYQYRG